MKLRSVNISGIKNLEFNGRMVKSGIDKKPVEGSVKLLKEGLVGDKQADLSVHGGLDKAVYVYSVEHYIYWQEKLDVKKLPYGQFGENFTVE